MKQNKLSYSSQNQTLFKSIQPIYELSFPEDERRDFEELISLTETEPTFYADVYTEGDETVGFITYWQFNDFIYVEHFAVDEKTRGKGYGKVILKNLLKQADLPIILEVEKPENDINKRRIRFYENMGFRLSLKPYLQPPYSPDKKAVPLLLMSYGSMDMDAFFDKIVDVLHTKVYKATIL